MANVVAGRKSGSQVKCSGESCVALFIYGDADMVTIVYQIIKTNLFKVHIILNIKRLRM